MSLAQDFSVQSAPARPRHDWTRAEVAALFALPFPELMFRAAEVHRAHFDPTEVQISTLLSIKTGGCPEDCAYCPQSAKYDTGVKAEKLMEVDTAPEFYGNIISTRCYQDRLDTLEFVRAAGINVCCGGIVGMGEGQDGRVGTIQAPPAPMAILAAKASLRQRSIASFSSSRRSSTRAMSSGRVLSSMPPTLALEGRPAE